MKRQFFAALPSHSIAAFSSSNVLRANFV